ncbi:hypothetical protein V5O48_017968 [Marasmius crinis-equi]|uniref:Uncharacterized protein n=1 Tax=Marasmius crinis-equi TaxID=585013 RepID=A0ABR3EMH0_9AGAR
MSYARQTRSGRTYLEFAKEFEEAQIIKIRPSAPALEVLLQEALDCEPPPNDTLETFESPSCVDTIFSPDTPQQPSSCPSTSSSSPCIPPASRLLCSPSAGKSVHLSNSLKRPTPPDESSQRPNLHRHRKRQKARDRKYERQGHLKGRNKEAIVDCMVQSSPTNVLDLPAARGGFIGRDLQQSEEVHDVDWYRTQSDWQYVQWDGSRALLLVDEHEHIFVAGLKTIKDPALVKEISQVANALEEARTKKLVVKPGADCHLRGQGFVAAATGWSMGQGQQKVTHTAGQHEKVMQELIREPCMKRLASMQDAGFACWSFKNYAYYKASMDQLKSTIPGFKPNFERSNFACITCNFGPQHVILEFPPACTILLPSVILRHENTPVQANETRYSVTQYSAGGIFRYQEYGNRTEEQLRHQDKVLYEKVMGERSERWARMLDMFVTLEDVRRFHDI